MDARQDQTARDSEAERALTTELSNELRRLKGGHLALTNAVEALIVAVHAAEADSHAFGERIERAAARADEVARASAKTLGIALTTFVDAQKQLLALVLEKNVDERTSLGGSLSASGSTEALNYILKRLNFSGRPIEAAVDAKDSEVAPPTSSAPTPVEAASATAEPSPATFEALATAKPAPTAPSMDGAFDLDPYPGRPRILFVGWPQSSHTTSWIDLLASEPFNVRLFCLPSQEPPADWPVRSYITGWGVPARDLPLRRSVHPQSVARLREPSDGTIEGSLAAVIREWRPDVIHTLGFDPASYLYLRARLQPGLEKIGRWVAQARGGPDLALQYFSPVFRPSIEEVLRSCDHFIADNTRNYELAAAWGLDRAKARDPGMGVVSGTGGIDVDELRAGWTNLPSERERVIVWPKCYETYTAKAMPVFEAILKAWPRIAPCRIEMLWLVQPEVRIWYEKLFPPELKAHCITHLRLTRDETLALIREARVMMAPSIADGIPNSMMEAMALGAAPLVSPLDTIVPVVTADENVVFARNLYPDEIAEGLVRLMTDDALVDRLARNNVERVRKLADRTRVRERAVAFYNAVATLGPQPPSS
jgi:glycosyltransferase involved in cell wall biosynthesis